jgi:hypothetical protein
MDIIRLPGRRQVRPALEALRDLAAQGVIDPTGFQNRT